MSENNLLENNWNRIEKIERIHQSSLQLVFSATGGGSLFLSDLLLVPGASRTLLEGIIPYSQNALNAWLGFVPDAYCSPETAQKMAQNAFQRALFLTSVPSHLISADSCSVKKTETFLNYLKNSTFNNSCQSFSKTEQKTAQICSNAEVQTLAENLLGVAVSASLATTVPKKGEHRFHWAITSWNRVRFGTVHLQKGKRSRAEEERLLADFLLQQVFGWNDPLFPNILTNERPKQPNYPKFFDSAPFFSSDIPIIRSKTERFFDIFSKIRKNKSASENNQSENNLLEKVNSNTSNLIQTDLIESNPKEIDLNEINPERIPSETALISEICVPYSWSQLIFGQGMPIRIESNSPQLFSNSDSNSKRETNSDSNPDFVRETAIFSGSFHPIHQGHIEMFCQAKKCLGCPVALEIAVKNVDKPPLDFIQLTQRLTQIRRRLPEATVWLTPFPRFVEKSAFFSSAWFVVGADTLRRIGDLKYCQNDPTILLSTLETFRQNGTRFLLFDRPVLKQNAISEIKSETNSNLKSSEQSDQKILFDIECLESLKIPDALKQLCQEVSSDIFLSLLSSTEIRNAQKSASKQ